MFLRRIKLKNILSMGPGGQDLALQPLNVRIGPNGSGKSNLVEAIGLLRAAPENLQTSIREGGGVANWVWRGEPRETFAENSSSWAHLKQEDGWNRPRGAEGRSAHLMVQCMEAWFLADKDGLATYFGRDLTPVRFPETRMSKKYPRSIC